VGPGGARRDPVQKASPDPGRALPAGDRRLGELAIEHPGPAQDGGGEHREGHHQVPEAGGRVPRGGVGRDGPGGPERRPAQRRGDRGDLQTYPLERDPEHREHAHRRDDEDREQRRRVPGAPSGQHAGQRGGDQARRRDTGEHAECGRGHGDEHGREASGPDQHRRRSRGGGDQARRPDQARHGQAGYELPPAHREHGEPCGVEGLVDAEGQQRQHGPAEHEHAAEDDDDRPGTLGARRPKRHAEREDRQAAPDGREVGDHGPHHLPAAGAQRPL